MNMNPSAENIGLRALCTASLGGGGGGGSAPHDALHCYRTAFYRSRRRPAVTLAARDCASINTSRRRQQQQQQQHTRGGHDTGSLGNKTTRCEHKTHTHSVRSSIFGANANAFRRFHATGSVAGFGCSRLSSCMACRRKCLCAQQILLERACDDRSSTKTMTTTTSTTTRWRQLCS